MLSVAEKKCVTDIVCINKSVGPDPPSAQAKSKELLQYTSGFHGFESLDDDQDLLDLGNVTFNTFAFLLKMLGDCRVCKLSEENRLLVFLFKMKLGLT